MKVSYPSHSGIFTSWDRDERTTLILSADGSGFRLQHIDPYQTSPSMTVVDLSHAQACSVAERIRLVLTGGTPKGQLSEGSPCLVVTKTTDGEPYREGVSISIDTHNWQQDFAITLTKDSAHELAKFLSISPLAGDR